jgi:hypothetical protein
MGWGRPNMVRNDKKKMSKAIIKDGMIRRTKNQAPKIEHAQDFNQM